MKTFRKSDKKKVKMIHKRHDSRLGELERIVSREQDRLFRFAYMRIGNRQDAEDIVQDVFLKLFRSEERLSGVHRMENYLFRSIHNSCLDYLRRKKYSLLPEGEAAGEPAPEDRRMHEEYLRINALLNQIPAEQAEIVRLRCIDGMKFRDIARLLGIPVPTAQSRYRYGIGHIRNIIVKQ